MPLVSFVSYALLALAVVFALILAFFPVSSCPYCGDERSTVVAAWGRYLEKRCHGCHRTYRVKR